MNDVVDIIGHDKLHEVFSLAPKAITNSVRNWFYAERRSYVGDKKSDGWFRKQLSKKQRKWREGGWPTKVVRAFKGYIEGSQLEKMTLHMGVGFKHGNKFTEALAKMEKGFSTRPNKSHWMPIPVYENLARIGITKSYSKNFRKLYDSSSLDPVLINGKLYYFDDRGTGDNKRVPLFIGYTSAKIPKQFDFTGPWISRQPQVMKRGERALQRTIQGIERGYVRAE